MIKIVVGTYGLLDPETGIVRGVTSKDGALSLSKEQEERLVALGVASYVETSEKAVETEGATYEDMTNKELEAIAEERGVELPKRARKADIIKALEESDAYDELDLPEMDAFEAVE